MKIALFGRYSSKMQDEMSMDAQLAEMEAFALKQGWEIVDRYLMPEVRSSELDRAPEFQRMLDDAKQKRWKLLLCHKLDRLGRDREMVVMFKAQLRRQGIEIRSVVENLSDTIEHRMLEGMFELFADYYAKNLGQETRKGHRQLTREGFWKGGAPAWGYITEKTQTGAKREHSKLVPCPIRAPIMAEVFRRFAAGEPAKKVLRWIANTTGEPWKPAALYARLKNPIYYGRLEYGRTSHPTGRQRKKLEADELTVGECPAIVSYELWFAANEKIKEKSLSHGRVPKNEEQPYVFSGMVRCQDCGSAVVAGRGGGYRYYRCSDRTCSNANIRAEALEREVLAKMLGFLGIQDRTQMLKAFAAQLEPLHEEAKKQEAEYRKQLTDVRARRRRLLDAIETGAGDAALYAERLRELKQQEDELASAIGICQTGADARINVNLSQLAEALDDLREAIEEMHVDDIPKMREMIQHLFDIEVSPAKQEGQLYLKLTLDVPAPASRFNCMVGVLRTQLNRDVLRIPIRKLLFTRRPGGGRSESPGDPPGRKPASTLRPGR